MQGIEQAKKQAAEEIWLSYFNEQAYAAGLIDEQIADQPSQCRVPSAERDSLEKNSVQIRYDISGLEPCG